MQGVTSGGRLMTYERSGTGHPVVLIHGYVGDGPSTFRPQLDALSDEFDVIALDLPGAGGSDDPPEDIGIAGFATAVVDFIAALGLDRPHLVGLSFGGVTIIELFRLHPDLAATVTLAGAYAGWPGSLPPEEVDHRLNQALTLSELPRGALVDALLPTMFTPAAKPDIVADFAESLHRLHPVGFRAMARACTQDLTELLPSIRRPTLLLYGEDDTRAPPGVAAQLHEAIAGSELVLLEGAGHVCSVDGADRFNEELRRFLRANPPT